MILSDAHKKIHITEEGGNRDIKWLAHYHIDSKVIL